MEVGGEDFIGYGVLKRDSCSCRQFDIDISSPAVAQSNVVRFQPPGEKDFGCLGTGTDPDVDYPGRKLRRVASEAIWVHCPAFMQPAAGDGEVDGGCQARLHLRPSDLETVRMVLLS